MQSNPTKMKSFTVEEFQEDFDNLLERVENGESFIITSEGKEVVIMPAKNYKFIVDEMEEYDDLIRIHTDHEEGS
jgi:prevent-host-death family protein